MPLPSVEPMPFDFKELRPLAPDEAQDASYFAASAKMASFSRRGKPDICSVYVLVCPSSNHKNVARETSDLVEVEVIVEFADGAGNAQIFSAFDRGEGAVHVFAERIAKEG